VKSASNALYEAVQTAELVANLAKAASIYEDLLALHSESNSAYVYFAQARVILANIDLEREAPSNTLRSGSAGLRDRVDEGQPSFLLHHLEPPCQGRADRLRVENWSVAVKVKAPG
jgi:hypothetical protein